MEPRKKELKNIPEHCNEERRRLFRIVKLEERIAPKCTRWWKYRYCGHHVH